MAIKTSLSSDDINKLMDQTTNLRDRLIVTFLYDTGCRVSEMLQVTWANIDLESSTILIPHLKRGIHKVCPQCSRQGGRRVMFCSKCGTNLSAVEAVGIEERSRIISIGDDLSKVIKDFSEGDNPDPTTLLIGITRQGVYEVLRKVSEAAGLGGRIMLNPETGKRHFVHPHSFRDSLATDWLSNYGDNLNAAKALQNRLGHKNFETTQRYNKLTAEAVNTYAQEIRTKRKNDRAALR